MSRRLDEYLQAVGRELPESRRESELREMRAHLEAIVARLVEGGASEDEAGEAAMAQFGEARSLGRELERSSVGREAWWRAAVAGLCSLGIYVLLMLALSGLVSLLLSSRVNWTKHTDWLIAISIGLSGLQLTLFPFVAGRVAGRMSPRQPFQAVAWWTAGCSAVMWALWMVVPANAGSVRFDFSFGMAQGLKSCLFLFSMNLGAYVGSLRGRGRRLKFRAPLIVEGRSA